MAGIAQFFKESPMAKRILWRLANRAIRSIPVIGDAYDLFDDVVIESIASQKQAEVNDLVGLMYEKFEPLMRELEEKTVTDEQLEAKLSEPEIVVQLTSFRKEIEKNKSHYEAVLVQMSSQIKIHGEKIETLTVDIAKLGKSLEIGAQFKYISQSVKHRISIQGTIGNLYDRMETANERGGQGVLWRAHRIGTPADKSVVVKTIKAKRAGDSKAIQRFLLEGFLASQILHENIVRISDYGGFFEKDEYYIEMEDLENRTAKEWCTESPFVGDNLEDYINILSQTTEALEAVHKYGLVHRDIKPSNLMVLENDMVKLIDFGSVKSLEAEENLRAGRTMTTTGEMVGTPQYMSPEQFGTEYGKICTETDVYCLGVTMFEMFTGQLPFFGGSAIQYGKAHAEQTPPRPSAINPKIPNWLDTLILRMLAKRAGNRPKIQSVKSTLEENRPQNMESMMAKVNKNLLKGATQGLNEETEKAIREAMSSLEKRMQGASGQIRNRLKEFIQDTEKSLSGLKVKKSTGVNRPFNPFLCPNMECNQELQSGMTECPQCQVTWKIECLCERKENTAYNKDKCQKCREGRAIPESHKKRHSLLATMDRCIAEKEYIRAINYLGLYENLKSDPEVSQKYEKAICEQKKKEQAEQQAVKQKIEAGIQEIERLKNTEDEEQKKIRLAQEEKQREAEIAKLQKIIAAEEYQEALEYYQNSFPQNLKNDKTEEVRDKAWDNLSKYEIAQAKALSGQKEYEKALEMLMGIAEKRPTKLFRDAVESIASDFAQVLYTQGDFDQALKVYDYASQMLKSSPTLAMKAKELQAKWQKQKDSLATVESMVKASEGGVEARVNLEQAEEILADEMYLEPMPKEQKDAYCRYVIWLQSTQILKQAKAMIDAGNMEQAESELRDPILLQEMGTSLEQRYLELARQLETAKRKARGITGKLRYMMKCKKKEQEDYEKVKQEYEQNRRTDSQKIEYYVDQFIPQVMERKRKEEEKERIQKKVKQEYEQNRRTDSQKIEYYVDQFIPQVMERKREEEEKERIQKEEEEFQRLGGVSKSSDRRYWVMKTGIILDTKTKLQWLVGLDKDTNWEEARTWVESIDSSKYGTGWRMPTRKELPGIYEKDKSKCNIDQVFVSPRDYLWVWSGKIKGFSSAHRAFGFHQDREYWQDCSFSFGFRVFSVRPGRQ